MTYDSSATIGQFLDAAAAKQPTPGGGAVTALAGALAAAMGEMVVNYSVGKKGLEAFEGELRPALRELNNARGVLLKLMVEDQSAYQALADARKLPEGSPERARRFPEALKASIAAPQAMAATAVAILGVCERIINFVNYHLLSDLAVAADLAMATTRCAIYSVRVNLPDVTDPSERQEIESTVGQVLIHAAMLIQQVAPRIWTRHGEGE
jgi:formiminotetrahydrofolate cyclodeaminase